MLITASERLRYLSPSVLNLTRILAASYTELAFLVVCRDKLAQGRPFAESFETAVKESDLSQKQREVLLPLATELGSNNLESQLAALSYAIGRLNELSAREQEYCRTHGKLYRTLGVLCGLAAAILVY
jgi:stage III sporulation protein AB